MKKCTACNGKGYEIVHYSLPKENGFETIEGKEKCKKCNGKGK